jgi:hypothetical protein
MPSTLLQNSKSIPDSAQEQAWKASLMHLCSNRWHYSARFEQAMISLIKRRPAKIQSLLIWYKQGLPRWNKRRKEEMLDILWMEACKSISTLSLRRYRMQQNHPFDSGLRKELHASSRVYKCQERALWTSRCRGDWSRWSTMMTNSLSKREIGKAWTAKRSKSCDSRGLRRWRRS